MRKTICLVNLKLVTMRQLDILYKVYLILFAAILGNFAVVKTVGKGGGKSNKLDSLLRKILMKQVRKYLIQNVRQNLPVQDLPLIY